jgi:putative sterol carrier protein
MTDFNVESLSAIGPKEFAQLVKTTPDSKLAEVMGGDSRSKILDEVFGRMPTLFRADKAGNTSAVIHWILTGGAGGSSDTYETVIENGACTVTNQPARDPKLAMTMDPLTFLKVVSGDGNPMMMFMTGKIKAKGDLALAAQVAKLFDIPKG